MRIGLVALIAAAACSGAAPAPAPPPTPTANELPPAPVGGRVALDRGDGARFLTFAADGDHLLGYGDGIVVAMDAVARTELGRLRLDSARAPNPNVRVGATRLLSWEIDSPIWAWDPEADELVGVMDLDTFDDAINGLAVWRPGSGLPIAIPSTAHACLPVALSADLRMVAIAATPSAPHCTSIHKTTIEVVDIETGRRIGATIDAGHVPFAAFSQDGRRLVVGREQVSVMTLATGDVATIAPTSPVRAIAIHPTSPRVAWATEEHEIEVWTVGDATTRKLGPGARVAFSPDGRYLAILGQELLLLDATTLDAVNSIVHDNGWHHASALVFSDDSAQIAYAGDYEVMVWQLTPVSSTRSDTWFEALQPLPVPPPKPLPPITNDGAVDGRVLADGKPVANAELVLTPNPHEFPDAVLLPPISTRTDADGAFRLDSVPTIEWSATVTAARHLVDTFTVDLRKSTTITKEITLKPAVTITGTVRGPDRRPAKGVRVFHVTDMFGVGEVEVVTDKRGRFVIDHVRPADKPYVITARRLDGAVRSASVAIAAPGKVTTKLTLLPATHDSVVRVVVVDEAGAPVTGAFVEIRQRGAGRTDATGAFSFDTTHKAVSVRVLTVYKGGRNDNVRLPVSEPVTITIAPW